METNEIRKLVEKTKKMLVSRDTNQQLLAVDLIYKTLQKISIEKDKYKLIEYFIKNDLCMFLGEASATLHPNLIQKIVWCLKCFSKVKMFYKNSYASYTTASLVRATQLYIKEDGKGNFVQNILYLLYEIFSGIDQNNCTPVLSINSIYDSSQIFNLLNSIVTKSDVSLETILLATKLLHTLLSDKNLMNKFNQKTVDSVAEVLNKYFKHLTKLLIENVCKLNKNKYLSCIFGLLCHVGADALNICNIVRNCPSNNVKNKKLDLVEFHQQNQIHSVENILNYVRDLMNVLITKIKACERFIDQIEYQIFLNFLNIFLNEPLFERVIPVFAERLMENDFLTLLPSLRAKSTDDEFRRLCQTNLAELIVILSHQKFNLSNWKGGKEEFRNHIYEGLLENDDDFVSWLQRVFDASSADSTINSLIVFLYFYCTSPSRSQDIIQKLLPYIVHYILNIPRNVHCPVPIIKCLWLIFAMSNSINANLSLIKGGKSTVERANGILSKIISTDVDNTYTHHIQILEWVYSSNRISFNLQNSVLMAWLENESELPPKLLHVSAVWFSLLDIVQNSNSDIATIAMNLLKHCLDKICNESDANKLKESLWDILPNILSYYIEENEIENELTLSCVLELCHNYLPKTIDMHVIIRTVFLLTSVIPLFVKKSDTLLFNFMSESFLLINVSLKQQNKMVLSGFINSETFMETVFNATKSSSNTLSTVAYKILSYSEYFQNIYNIEFVKTFAFDLSVIVKCLLTENDNEKCCAILQLIFVSFNTCHTELEKTQLISIIPNYSNEYSIKTYRALFFRLQMICCKESVEQSQSGWQCLNAFMEFSIRGKDKTLIKIVAVQPWTHVLIRYYLSSIKPRKVHINFLKFINNWLLCLSEKCTISDLIRKGFKNTVLLKTIDLLVNTFSDNVRKELDERKRSLLCNIFNLIDKNDDMEIEFVSN